MAKASDVEFQFLAEAFEKIEATSKRLELTQLLLEFLQALPVPLVDKAVLMLQGKLYPDFVGIELGVAEKLTIKALARTYGAKEEEVVALQKQLGDVGLAAEGSMLTSPLTVHGVYSTFEKIAKAQGAGSQDQKINGLSELLAAASPLAARYIVRLATGKLRLGVADQTAIEAVAILLSGGKAGSITELEDEEREKREEAKALAQRALDVTSDLGTVVQTALDGGIPALRKLKLKLGVPLRPMLAERAETLEEALSRMPGRAFIEYKYDGLRMQAHIGKSVEIFSRRLERLTTQFPDVVADLEKAFGGKSVIVEGEAVAIDPASGRLRPFQELSQRRGRKYGLGDGLQDGDSRDVTKEIPVKLFLFDLLWVDGEDYTERPLSERRALLEKLLKPNKGAGLGDLRAMSDVKELEEYFQDVTTMGAEGIMIKNPESPYQAGSRGYSWIKFKADYNAALADTFDLVAIGAYWGQGRRGGWYGALLLASVNEETGRYESLCRLATGFDDATLAGLEARFKDHVASSKPKTVDSTMTPDVWLNPALVLEVQGAELTLSPNHRCAWGDVKPEAGLSVRFPRFTGRWRDDKKANQATTSEEVLKMFQARRKKQGFD
jgi:DNA ligase 1